MNFKTTVAVLVAALAAGFVFGSFGIAGAGNGKQASPAATVAGAQCDSGACDMSGGACDASGGDCSDCTQGAAGAADCGDCSSAPAQAAASCPGGQGGACNACP